MNKQLLDLMNLLVKRKGIMYFNEDPILHWVKGFHWDGYTCLFCQYKFPGKEEPSLTFQGIQNNLDKHALFHLKEHKLLVML